MSLLTHIRKQPEDVRRVILLVTMVIVGVIVGTFGMGVIKARIMAVDVTAVARKDTPFALVAGIVKQGYADAGTAFSHASEGWSDVATVFQAWNMSR